MPADAPDNLSERLTALGRVERAGKPEAGMPTDTAFTEKQQAELLDWLARYQAEHSVSDRVVARRIGCGTSTLVEVRRGRYRGNTQKILAKLAKLKTQPLPNARELDDMFVETTFVRDIYGVVRGVIDSCADGHPTIGLVIAPAGSGKSIGLRGIAHRHSEAIYMEIAETHTHFRAFLVELGRLLKIQRYASRNTSDLFAAICERLSGSYRLLIFDEVHLATKRIQNSIRQIQDRTGCPVILAGLAELENQILAGRFDESRGATVSSRIGLKCDYRNLTRTASPSPGRRARGRELLHTAADVKLLLDREHIKIHPDALHLVIALANDEHNGMLRLMDRLLYQIRRAFPEESQIRESHILDALDNWIGAVQVEQLFESWRAEQLDRRAERAARRATA